MLLDEADWALLRELYRWEGNRPEGALRAPIGDMTKRTGQHPNTVRARLRALRRGGVLEGSYFEPWPRAVGLARVGWMLRGVPATRLPDVARALDDASVSVAAVGPDWIFLHAWARDEAATLEEARAVGKRVGARDAPERHYSSASFPPHPADGRRFSRTEARLALALHRKPDRSMAAVARELGVTTRTGERRARALLDAGAGAMVPKVRIGRADGWLLVHFLLVEGDARASAGSLAKAFPDRVIGPFGSGINAGVAVPLRSLREVEERQAAAERLPGIVRLEPLLVRDLLYPRAFDATLARAVAS